MLLEELHKREYIETVFDEYEELSKKQPELSSELFIFEKMVLKRVKKLLKKMNLTGELEKKDIKEIIHFSSISFTEGSLVAALRMDYCNRCGWCCENCSPIYITKEEYGVYQNSDKVVTADMEPFKEGYKFTYDRPCEHFVRSTKKCDIYHERPGVCRAFPVLINNENEYGFIPNHYCKYSIEFVVQKAITVITTCLKIREDPEYLKDLERIIEDQTPDKDGNLEDRMKKWNDIADKYEKDVE